MQKTLGGILKRKAQINVSGRDLGLMSLPVFPLSASVQLRLGFFSYDQASCSFFDLVVVTSIGVATSLAHLFSRIDVATLVSRRNLVVVPFCCILSHDLSFRLQPPFSCHHFSSELGIPFLAALSVVISVLGCDHISISTASPQVVTFLFRLRPPFWSSALICLEFRL